MSSKTSRRARPEAKGERRNSKWGLGGGGLGVPSHLGIWVRVIKSIRVKERKGFSGNSPSRVTCQLTVWNQEGR